MENFLPFLLPTPGGRRGAKNAKKKAPPKGPVPPPDMDALAYPFVISSDEKNETEKVTLKYFPAPSLFLPSFSAKNPKHNKNMAKVSNIFRKGLIN